MNTQNSTQNNVETVTMKESPERPVKTFGMTSAISTAGKYHLSLSYNPISVPDIYFNSVSGPKPIDIEKNTDLKSCLEKYEIFESESEMHHRMEILGKLLALVRKWIRDLSAQRNLPSNVAENVGGNIYTFGSYRLGVQQKGADIDALCVAPLHVDRTEYFSSFMELLKQQDEVIISSLIYLKKKIQIN